MPFRQGIENVIGVLVDAMLPPLTDSKVVLELSFELTATEHLPNPLGAKQSFRIVDFLFNRTDQGAVLVLHKVSNTRLEAMRSIEGWESELLDPNTWLSRVDIFLLAQQVEMVKELDSSRCKFMNDFEFSSRFRIGSGPKLTYVQRIETDPITKQATVIWGSLAPSSFTR